MRRLILAAAILAMTALTSCVMPTIELGDPDFSALPDGTYRGSFDGGLVKAEVELYSSSGAITDIRLLRHDCGKGKPAGIIVERVMQAQSLRVDTVSGATYSSKVILRAIENAIAGS
jgi:uncharacterized protein with FMN-binding domain